MDKGSISCHTKHAQAGGAIPAAFTMPSKPPKQALRRAKVLLENLQLLQVAPPGGRLCNQCRWRHTFSNYKAIQVNGTCWPNSWLNWRLLNVCGCTKVTVDPQDSCCTKSVGMHGDWGGLGGLGGHVRPSDKTWRRLQLIFHCPTNTALYNIQHCTTLHYTALYIAPPLSYCTAHTCTDLYIKAVDQGSISVGSKHQKLTSDRHSDCRILIPSNRERIKRSNHDSWWRLWKADDGNDIRLSFWS